VIGLDARVVVERDGFTLDADLTVDPGEIVAVLGPNGAGKSTLLRAISGLEAITAGTISCDGTVVDDPSRGIFVPASRRRIGMVFQEYRLFPHLTVLENVAFGPRSTGMARTEARPFAGEFVDRLGLTEFADRRVDSISGGQAQRVALARALASRPQVLLLDEPLAALDASTRLDVRAWLREHLRGPLFRGPTVLVTHDAVDGLALADRIVVLEDGRITQQGTALDVARRPATDYVARLLGLNLLRGGARDGAIALHDGGHLQVPDTAVVGDVFVAVRPSAIVVSTQRPEGSARNVWEGVVDGVEPIGDRVRVTVTGPPTVVAEVTRGAVSDLHVARGDSVWLSVKATELEVYPG